MIVCAWGNGAVAEIDSMIPTQRTDKVPVLYVSDIPSPHKQEIMDGP